MTILDTNVISEPMRPRPSPQVAQWLASQEGEDLFITTITQAELLSGVERLPAGARKRDLRKAAETALLAFAGRILAFDEDAAHAFPGIVAGRSKLGRPVSTLDALIAATARSRDAALATRNVRDFQHCGVRLIDPWAG